MAQKQGGRGFFFSSLASNQSNFKSQVNFLLGYEGLDVINPDGGTKDAEVEAQRGRWRQECAIKAIFKSHLIWKAEGLHEVRKGMPILGLFKMSRFCASRRLTFKCPNAFKAHFVMRIVAAVVMSVVCVDSYSCPLFLISLPTSSASITLKT